MPLSEISEQFAFFNFHPWHLESACEWLERKGLLQKVSAPFKLTEAKLQATKSPPISLMSELLRRPARERFGNSELHRCSMRQPSKSAAPARTTCKTSPGNSPRQARCCHGNERVRQILPCVRHTLRGRPEAPPGVDVDLCEAVHRPTQETRRRLRERSLARRLDRPENRWLKPTVDRRHDDRYFRLLANALCDDGHAALSCGEPLVFAALPSDDGASPLYRATPRSKSGAQPTRSTARTLNTCLTRFA